MLDTPAAVAVLAAVADALRAGIPEGFQQKVAANAIALAMREQDFASDLDIWERASLSFLLGTGGDGDTGDLNKALCLAIRSGEVGVGDSALTDYLRAVTMRKVAIDQPAYPPFRAANEKE